MSAKNVWGKIVLFLKERRFVALHVACGDITDVGIENNNLVVNVEEGMLATILAEGKRELENALRWQGLDLNLEIKLKKSNLSGQEEDIKKLKTILGNKLTIIGGN